MQFAVKNDINKSRRQVAVVLYKLNDPDERITMVTTVSAVILTRLLQNNKLIRE